MGNVVADDGGLAPPKLNRVNGVADAGEPNIDGVAAGCDVFGRPLTP
jgi:hypothetical protein